MRYSYFVAYSVRGVISESAAGRPSIEFASPKAEIFFSDSIAIVPEEVDMRAAVAAQMLAGLTANGAPDPGEDLLRRMEKIQRDRKEMHSRDVGHALMALKAEGDVDDLPLDEASEREDYILSLSKAADDVVKKRYEHYLKSVLTALAMSSPQTGRAKKIAESVTYYREDGKRIFFFELGGKINAYTAVPLTDEVLSSVRKRTLQLTKDRQTTETARLIAKSLDDSNEPLMEFLSVWTALEIFVNKVFGFYETRMFERLGSVPLPRVSTSVLKSMREFMKGKFRLVDKFAVIAEDLDAGNASADVEEFKSVKKIRDSLLHGEDIPIDSLPSDRIRNIVKKYLDLHLDVA